MTTAQSFPKWTSEDVPVRGSGEIEFKLVMANENGQDAHWEGGNNRKLKLPEGHHMVIVRSTFEKPDTKMEAKKLTNYQEAPPPAKSSFEEEAPLITAERTHSWRRQNTSRHLIQNEDGSMKHCQT